MKSNHFIIFLCVVFALSYLTVIIAAEEQNGGLETLPDFKIGEKKQAEKEGKCMYIFLKILNKRIRGAIFEQK